MARTPYVKNYETWEDLPSEDTPITAEDLQNYDDGIKGIDEDLATVETNGIIGTSQYGGTLVTNVNTINKDGFYTAYGDATGVPSTGYSWWITHENSQVGTASATQTAKAFISGEPTEYIRNKISSTWGAWFLLPKRSEISDLQSGWIFLISALTFSSYNADTKTLTVTTTTDLSSVICCDDKLKFTHSSSTKYATVKTVVYATGTCTITLFLGNDYTVSSGNLSNIYYSHELNPIGLPLEFRKNEYVLYSNSTGINTGTVPLAIAISAFRYIEITCKGTTSGVAILNTFKSATTAINTSFLVVKPAGANVVMITGIVNLETSKVLTWAGNATRVVGTTDSATNECYVTKVVGIL